MINKIVKHYHFLINYIDSKRKYVDFLVKYVKINEQGEVFMDKQAIKNFKTEGKAYLRKFKQGTRKMFKNLKSKDSRKKELANSLTFARLLTPFIAIILSTIAVLTNVLPLFTAAGIITILGGSTDFFDGIVARKTNSTSEYGKQLDQVTDKVFAIMLGIDLTIINPLFIIPILGEGIIALINLKYKLNYSNLTHKSTLIGKAKEFPLFLALGLGYFCPVNSICLNIVKILLPLTLVLQSGAAISYVIENEKEIQKLKRNNELKKIEKEDIKNSNKVNEYEKEKAETKSKTSERLEQYKDLKKLLLDVKHDEKSINKTYQKRK